MKYTLPGKTETAKMEPYTNAGEMSIQEEYSHKLASVKENLLFLSSAVKEFLINDQVHVLVLRARKVYSHLRNKYS